MLAERLNISETGLPFNAMHSPSYSTFSTSLGTLAYQACTTTDIHAAMHAAMTNIACNQFYNAIHQAWVRLLRLFIIIHKDSPKIVG